MNIKRTHDTFYLKEDSKKDAKEYFKQFITNYGMDFEDKFKEWGGSQLCDIGCATGDLLNYLSKEFNKNNNFNVNMTGIDVMPELLEQAQNKLEGIEYILANVADKETLKQLHEKFDFCTMFGVLSIFDSFETILDNVMDIIKKEGSLYLFGIFNPEPVDVLIKSRHVSTKEDIWESGWNIFALESIKQYIANKNYKAQIQEFQIDLEIPKHEDDPLRSWTLNMENNKKLVVNGLQIVHTFYFIKIIKN